MQVYTCRVFLVAKTEILLSQTALSKWFSTRKPKNKFVSHALLQNICHQCMTSKLQSKYFFPGPRNENNVHTHQLLCSMAVPPHINKCRFTNNVKGTKPRICFGRKASDKMKGFHPSSQKRFLSVDGRWHEAQKIQLKKNMRILLNKPVEKPLRSQWFAHPVLSVMKNTKNSVLQQAPAWSWCNLNHQCQLQPASTHAMKFSAILVETRPHMVKLYKFGGSGSTMADGR